MHRTSILAASALSLIFKSALSEIRDAFMITIATFCQFGVTTDRINSSRRAFEDDVMLSQLYFNLHSSPG